MSRNGLVLSAGYAESEEHDRQDKRERAEEVQGRGDDRDAVVVRVEPQPVREDGRVVADDDGERRGHEAADHRDRDHPARPGPC